MHSELGLHNQSQRRGVAVVGWQREAEAAEEESEEDLQLDHGEVLAEAGPRAEAEGQVGVREPTGAEDSAGEPLGVELENVGPPDAWVVVQGRDLNEDVDAFGDADAPELHLLPQFSRHVGSDWVQPQRLLEHHGQLRPR